MGSSSLRSCTGSPVRAMIVCFPTSSRRWLDSVTTSHDRDTATTRLQTQTGGDWLCFYIFEKGPVVGF
uniref:Uncharacterized protein n=1 Tax=Kalanchoe fedtschenkoi TaxID=63787 RepID=A0A7N0TQD9_KALFE